MYVLVSSSSASEANSSGRPSAIREKDVPLEPVLECLRVRGVVVDRRVDQPGGDRVDADADDREVTCKREREADDAALRRAVGDLPDLPVEGGRGRGVEDRAALAVGIGLETAHGRGRDPGAVERADEVHADRELERVEPEGRGVLAVAADRARGDADAGAVDERPQRAEPGGRVDRRDDLDLVADVGTGEDPADLVRDAAPALLVEVEHRDPGAALGEQARRRFAEPRGATGDKRRRSLDLHVPPSPRSPMSGQPHSAAPAAGLSSQPSPKPAGIGVLCGSPLLLATVGASLLATVAGGLGEPHPTGDRTADDRLTPDTHPSTRACGQPSYGGGLRQRL